MSLYTAVATTQHALRRQAMNADAIDEFNLDYITNGGVVSIQRYSPSAVLYYYYNYN